MNTDYALLPQGAGGGPAEATDQVTSPDPLYPVLPEGSATSFVRQRDLTIPPDPTPLFPGQKYQGFNPYFGNINRQLENSTDWYPDSVGAVQNIGQVTPEGVNAHATDPWAMHAGDVNLTTGYWDATTGEPRQDTSLVASGPVSGRASSLWSGFVAMLRTPSAGSPGPVAGRIGADYAESVAMANAEVAYSTQLLDSVINNAVFGAI